MAPKLVGDSLSGVVAINIKTTKTGIKFSLIFWGNFILIMGTTYLTKLIYEF
jgi:hypothetical protein